MQWHKALSIQPSSRPFTALVPPTLRSSPAFTATCKLMLVTNVTDLTPPEVVQRYEALAHIGRGFRVLKSEIEIAPVYHRLPERIRAHALVCFLALIVYRVMRQRLKLAKSDLSPERALAELRKIQRHTVRINKAEPISGISTINDSQAALLETLKIRKPTQDAQLTLL